MEGIYFILRSSPLVSKVYGKGLIERPYNGMNVSRGREPIDQLDAFFLARRVGVPLLVFIAGKYGVLNQFGAEGDIVEKAEKLVEKERQKVLLLDAAAKVLRVDVSSLATDALWKSPIYWKIAIELLQMEGIIGDQPGFPFGRLPSELFSRAETFFEFRNMVAKVPGKNLYTLLEVAEAVFFSRHMDIDCKIGPLSEEMYDQFIRNYMSVIQLEQPLALGSTQKYPQPAIPYIMKDKELRITFDDSKAEIDEKVFRCAQRNVRTSSFRVVTGSRTLNPFLRLAVIGTLAAEVMDFIPLRLGSKKINRAEDVVLLSERTYGKDYAYWAGVISELLWNLVRRVNSELARASAPVRSENRMQSDMAFVASCSKKEVV